MRRLSIRYKLFITFSLLGIIILSTSFYVAYNSARRTLQNSILSELNNTTALITNLVQAVASTSVENHLKSIAETQLAMVAGLYDAYMSGYYTEDEAKVLAGKLLLSQDIGASGYLYCLNSRGDVVVHRDMHVLGSNVLTYAFAREQVRRKTGYIEYCWKNSDDAGARDKALYMTYFKPWDWIISATAYKNEFVHLIDMDNINKSLKQVKFSGSASGYPYIVSSSGDYIYHPSLSGNLYDSELNESAVATVEKIIALKQGTVYYQWQNPGEPEPRDKISINNYLADYDWVVGSSAYLDELYQPLMQTRQTFIYTFLTYALLVLLISYVLSTLITNPLKSLIAHLRDQSPTDAQRIMHTFSNDEVGALAGYLNQFIDNLNDHHKALTTEIAERKQSENALRDSEQTFNTLFDNSFQLIALLDIDGRICKINKTALIFHRVSGSAVLGKYFWDMPWGRYSQTLAAQLEEAYAVARAGEIARLETHSKNNRESYFDISLKPVLNDAQQVIYIVAEARDVTDVRRAELELQQAQKMESVGTLAGGIAHDFNNILGGILGTLTLLKRKREKGLPLSEEALFKHLDTVSSTALRAKGIVDQLLTLSRKHALVFIPLDLRHTLENVNQIIQNSFDKSILIETQLGESIPVRGDANSLEQVFLNVCINAAHAMTIMRPQQEFWGGTLSIRQDKVFREERTGISAGEYWRITLEDTGVGMDQATQKRIFEPFFSTKEKNSGSGLGLSMVYNIVQQHQGFIDITSTLKQGTSVAVYLPVGQEIPGSAKFCALETIESGEGVILIIDDEELIRDIASDILLECGYEILTAENGQEGIDVFTQHQHQITLVLLDLVMPIMSGRETFYALRKIAPNVKILLSSGFRHDKRVAEVLAAGADGFIQKPYSLYKLTSEIKQLH